MANINTVIEGNLLIVNVTGKLTADEAIAVIKEFYPSGLVKDVIWDLTNGTMGSISFGGFHEMARTAKMVISFGARMNGRTVFVGVTDEDHTVNKMYTVIAEVTGVPVTYKVCRTIDEARNWLKQNVCAIRFSNSD